MATKKQRGNREPPKEEAAKSGKTGGKARVLLTVFLVLLSLAMGAGATWFALIGLTPNDMPDKLPPLVYHDLEPLTVNLERGPAQFLRLNLALATRNPAVIEAIQRHMPMVRNDLLSYLMGQDFAEINQPDGKERLRQELQDLIVGILERTEQPTDIERIFFVNFVMQ